jgi:hypothetical protein
MMLFIHPKKEKHFIMNACFHILNARLSCGSHRGYYQQEEISCTVTSSLNACGLEQSILDSDSDSEHFVDYYALNATLHHGNEEMESAAGTHTF